MSWTPGATYIYKATFPPRHAAWKAARDESVEDWLRSNRLDSYEWAGKMQIESDGTIVVKHLADVLPREVYIKEDQRSILADALKAIEQLKRL